MLNASQNYIIPELNCNNILNNSLYPISNNTISSKWKTQEDFTIIVIIVKFVFGWYESDSIVAKYPTQQPLLGILDIN